MVSTRPEITLIAPTRPTKDQVVSVRELSWVAKYIELGVTAVANRTTSLEMQPDHWRAACKLIYMLPFAVVFSWACSSGDNGGSRLVLPKDVNKEELLAAIPADALPNNFEELSRDLEVLKPAIRLRALKMRYGDGDGNIVVFVIVVEAADAQLERHIQRGGYERIPLSAVTGLQSTLGPGEECDQSADITSPTACAWRPLPNPKLGEDSAAYETVIPSFGRTGRVFLFCE